MSSPDPMSSETVPELPPDFGRHNMFAFGRDTVFLSHLPMFMAPHDAQLILEVALENADGSSLQAAWSRERESHPDDRLYTMMPEKFALSTLYVPDPPERGSFRARFFRGHLERGGEPIPELADVDVRITDVVYAKRFDKRGRPDDLTYLLLGRGGELFLAHVISSASRLRSDPVRRAGGSAPGRGRAENRYLGRVPGSGEHRRGEAPERRDSDGPRARHRRAPVSSH